MTNSLQKIEMSGNHTYLNRDQPEYKFWYNSRKLIVFTLIFLLSAASGLTYVYSRPALFRSYATLLTVAQTDIDQRSSEADIQHVAIQRQILTGQELLHETLSRLNQEQEQEQKERSDDKLFLTNLTIPELRHMLAVQAIPETNLVELAATAYHPKILAPLINTWIDVYLERRAEEIRQTTGLTLEALREELSGLKEQILIKRHELADFREANNITSLGRENIFENQSLAHFKGLNHSLNKANEEVIKTKAQLDAVNKGVNEGKIVLPDRDKQEMRTLELRLQKLQKQLTEFDRKYTRNYLALHPDLNLLPEEIKQLEKEIKIKRSYGQNTVLTESRHNYEVAQLSLSEIKKQLEEHKQEASIFSSRFTEQESLLTALEGLEKLHQTTQERLIQIEAKQAEKFPQVKVIERAFLPRKPISPDYTRDAVIVLISSIFLSIFAVWLVEYLTRRENDKASISVSDINIYNDSHQGYQKINEALNQNTSRALQHEHNNALEQPLHKELSHRELSIEEISTLLEASDIKAKQIIALLLSGLTLDEISRLEREDIDFNKKAISISEEDKRTIPLNYILKALFENIEPCPAWNKKQSTSISTLEAIITYAVIDAGLSEAGQFTAESISHSYIIYLIKQGIRLSELGEITGDIEPTRLSEYGRHSPDKKGLSISEIDLIHPSLKTLAK